MSSSRFGTNVRFRHKLLGMAIAALGRFSPRLAARLLTRAFGTPRRSALSPEERALLAAGRTEQIWVGDGMRVAVTSWGTPGPVALLVHGWSGRGAQLAPFVRPLLDEGFQVVALDAPAHGDSPGRRSNLLEMTAALAAVARRHPPVAIVAHSVGAVAATVAMAEGVSAERAVFLAPADDPWTFLLRLSAYLDLSPTFAHRARRDLELRFGLGTDDLVASRRAGTIGASLLVFHDPSDREVPLDHGERLVAAWPGARLETTRGLGHRRILADPTVVAAAVEFLSRSAPRAGAARLRRPALATW